MNPRRAPALALLTVLAAPACADVVAAATPPPPAPSTPQPATPAPAATATAPATMPPATTPATATPAPIAAEAPAQPLGKGDDARPADKAALKAWSKTRD